MKQIDHIILYMLVVLYCCTGIKIRNFIIWAYTSFISRSKVSNRWLKKSQLLLQECQDSFCLVLSDVWMLQVFYYYPGWDCIEHLVRVGLETSEVAEDDPLVVMAVRTVRTSSLSIRLILLGCITVDSFYTTDNNPTT